MPHLASPGNFFQGAAASGDLCGRVDGARLHNLADTSSTVSLAIHGSDKLYSGAVELFGLTALSTQNLQAWPPTVTLHRLAPTVSTLLTFPWYPLL